MYAVLCYVAYDDMASTAYMFDDHYLLYYANSCQVPIFTRKEEIFDNLCEKDVPISRAAWYIKVKGKKIYF